MLGNKPKMAVTKIAYYNRAALWEEKKKSVPTKGWDGLEC